MCLRLRFPICVCMCVNPNKGYPIEDKIRPAQPYTADEAESAKKSSGWCKLTVEAQGRVKRKRARS